MAWNRYVALGDSFTEGMNDTRADGSLRGWADRLAEALAAQNPDFTYANLAVRGKLLRQVAHEQVPVALALRPDLVTLFAGANDVLRPRVDMAALIEQFDATVAELRAGGADVLVFVGGGVSRAAGQREGAVARRIQVLNRAIAATAARYGALTADIGHADVFGHPDMWSEDRLHLSSQGHDRIAAIVAEALHVPYPTAGWREPLPPAPPVPWLVARRADARWARVYVLPWIGRRVRGRSSGDGRPPKRPELRPF